MYPADVYDPRTKENLPTDPYVPEKTTKLFAEDLVNLDTHVVAVETTLGLNPQGLFETVRERLDQISPSGWLVKTITYPYLMLSVVDHILLSRQLKNEVVTSFAHQVPLINGVVVAVTATGGAVSATFTLLMIDANGDEKTDEIVVSADPLQTVAGKFDYLPLHIISLTVSGVTGLLGTYKVGIDRRVGVVNYPLGAESDVLKLSVNGEEMSLFAVAPEFGSVDLQGPGVASGDNIIIVYKPSLIE